MKHATTLLLTLLLLATAATAQVWVRRRDMPPHCLPPGTAYTCSHTLPYFEACGVYKAGQGCATFCYDLIAQYLARPKYGWRCYRRPTWPNASYLYGACRRQCRAVRRKLKEVLPTRPTSQGLVWLYNRGGVRLSDKLVFRLGRPQTARNCWYCGWTKTRCPSRCRGLRRRPTDWFTDRSSN